MPAKRFLFTTIGGESGQLIPIFAVASRLVSRGHHVRMLLGPSPTGADSRGIVDRAEAAGCETSVIQLSRADAVKVPAMRHLIFGWTPERIGMPVAMLHRVYAFTPQFAAQFAAELARSPVDAVAADSFYPGAMIAAEAAGVPAVSLMHNPYHSVRPRLVPRGAGHRPAGGPADRIRHAVQLAIHRRLASRNALPGLNAARVRMGLAPVHSLAEHEDGLVRVLVLSSPTFDFHPQPLPPNVRIVGWPVKAAPSDGELWKPTKTDAGQPLVLLSPSTTTQAQEQLPFFNRALEGISELEVQGLLTVGPSAQTDAFAAPPNVSVEPYVPHSAVMPRASLIVSHCGHGTVMTALSYGVPVLCVPYGRDQYDVAARVVWAGAGLEISKDATTAEIRQAIRTMTDAPDFKKSAQKLAAAMAAEDGAETAANELEVVAQTGASRRS